MSFQGQTRGISETMGRIGIDALHDEILILIMTCNAFHLYIPIGWRARIQPNTIPLHLQDTINASQVCHRWRVVALTSPELWSHMIDMYHPQPEWSNLLLNRSEPLGITFMKSAYSIKLPHSHIESELKLAPRINEYRLDTTSFLGRIPKIISENIKFWGIFPRLQSLRIEIYACDKPEGTRTLEGFPGHATPNLRHLYVAGSLSIHYPGLKSLSKLRTLHIDHPPYEYALKTNQFLDILTYLPLLDDLSIMFAFRESHPDTFMPRHITIPLKKLVLHGWSIPFAQFIHSLTFQTKNLECYELNILGEGSDLAAYEYIFDLLPTLTLSHVPTQRQIPHWNIFEFTHHGYEFHFSNNSKSTFAIFSNSRLFAPFHFHISPEFRGTSSYYYNLHETYSDLIHTIILELPTTVCAFIDTLAFSPLVYYNHPLGNEMAWLVAFANSMLYDKFSHVRHLSKVPWSWWRIIYVAMMHFPRNTSEVGYGAQASVEDKDTLKLECITFDFSDLKMIMKENIPNRVLGSNRFSNDIVPKRRNNKKKNDFVFDEVDGTDGDDDDNYTSSQSSSILYNSDESFHDSDSDFDSDSESDYEREPTFYDGIIELCKEMPSIRKFAGVHQEDVNLDLEPCAMFEPRSRRYLEQELEALGVEIEFR